MTKEEIYKILYCTETSRVERTISTGDMDKFQEAICAFSNDMSNSRQNGYLIIGAKDNGELSGLKVDDNLFKKISGIRSDGNILPIPMMTCERYELEGGDILVVEV
ncbi:MAG: ATP-binding protein, partial [Bacteroidales bacterium]|nr:ATP-binding protein [Bacteroidales bacterium]